MLGIPLQFSRHDFGVRVALNRILDRGLSKISTISQGGV